MLQFIICYTLLVHRPMFLKAIYTPVPGTDIEYGQGAVERLDLAHRVIERNVWIIAVPESGDWEARLNAEVDPRHGRFRVMPAEPEEVANIELQR